MTQYDIKPRNLGERIRKRAWRAISRGDLRAYERLSALAMEVGSIRDV